MYFDYHFSCYILENWVEIELFRIGHWKGRIKTRTIHRKYKLYVKKIIINTNETTKTELKKTVSPGRKRQKKINNNIIEIYNKDNLENKEEERRKNNNKT